MTFLHLPQAKSFPPSTDCSFAQNPQIFPINCSLLASSSLTIRISSLLMPLLSLVNASDLTLIPSLSLMSAFPPFSSHHRSAASFFRISARSPGFQIVALPCPQVPPYRSRALMSPPAAHRISANSGSNDGCVARECTSAVVPETSRPSTGTPAVRASQRTTSSCFLCNAS